MKQQRILEYFEHGSEADLEIYQRDLIHRAREAAQRAYAPYSNFYVGAALLLENGMVLGASNKENASFPAGTCAERNALNVASDQYPNVKIKAVAIVAEPGKFEMNDPLAPCGICRQVLAEVEQVQGSPIEIIMGSSCGKSLIVKSTEQLLPFAFYLSELKN